MAAVPFVILKRDDAWSLARVPALSPSRALSPPPFNLPLPMQKCYGCLRAQLPQLKRNLRCSLDRR